MNFSPGRWEHSWAVCMFKIFPELYLPRRTLCMGRKLIATSALLFLKNRLIAMAVLCQVSAPHCLLYFSSSIILELIITIWVSILWNIYSSDFLISDSTENNFFFPLKYPMFMLSLMENENQPLKSHLIMSVYEILSHFRMMIIWFKIQIKKKDTIKYHWNFRRMLKRLYW